MSDYTSSKITAYGWALIFAIYSLWFFAVFYLALIVFEPNMGRTNDSMILTAFISGLLATVQCRVLHFELNRQDSNSKPRWLSRLILRFVGYRP